MLRWLAHFALRRNRAILATSAAVLALAGMVLAYGGALGSGTTKGLESAIVQEMLGRELAYPGDSSFLILFHSRDFDWLDPRYRTELEKALAPLRADPRVRLVLAPDDAPQLVGER